MMLKRPWESVRSASVNATSAADKFHAHAGHWQALRKDEAVQAMPAAEV